MPAPDKANPPLLVDADAVLPGPIPPEDFQMIAGRIPQVIHCVGGIQLAQLPQGAFLNISRQFP
jgi:hypothetical protein